MKNKAGYILLPLVVAVWALIGYRVLGFLKQDKISVSDTKTEEPNISLNNLVQDTFSIEANYRDPFIAQQVQHVVVTGPPQKVVQPKPVAKQNQPWPTISYLGLVKNNKSNKALAMVTFNKKLRNMGIGDETDGIKIIDIQRDSLVAKFNGERKSFIRGKKNEKAGK